MFRYREVIGRLRAKDTDREIARSGLLGRAKVASLRSLALAQDWLQADTPMPDEARIASLLGQHKRSASTVSSVQPWRELIAQWHDEGVQGTVIHAHLLKGPLIERPEPQANRLI